MLCASVYRSCSAYLSLWTGQKKGKKGFADSLNQFFIYSIEVQVIVARGDTSEATFGMVKSASMNNVVLKTIAKEMAQRRPRTIDMKGLRAAKQATSMTKDQWAKLQKGMVEKWPVPEYMKQVRPNSKGHTSYRAETLEIMSRMKADTKIAYRPHAKAPGSAKSPNKSHARYEAYMSAKNAAMALKCGAWPIDWCWDYERGYLSVETDTLRGEAVGGYACRHHASGQGGIQLVPKGNGEEVRLEAHRLALSGPW